MRATKWRRAVVALVECHDTSFLAAAKRLLHVRKKIGVIDEQTFEGGLLEFFLEAAIKLVSYMQDSTVFFLTAGLKS